MSYFEEKPSILTFKNGEKNITEYYEKFNMNAINFIDLNSEFISRLSSTLYKSDLGYTPDINDPKYNPKLKSSLNKLSSYLAPMYTLNLQSKLFLDMKNEKITVNLPNPQYFLERYNKITTIEDLKKFTLEYRNTVIECVNKNVEAVREAQVRGKGKNINLPKFNGAPLPKFSDSKDNERIK